MQQYHEKKKKKKNSLFLFQLVSFCVFCHLTVKCNSETFPSPVTVELI